MNFLKKLSDNLLFFVVIFLLAFIPLYPKIPLVDIKNTWVYIRVEDILVLLTFFVWFVYFIKRKVTLKTPLTIPIFCFWIIGAIATIHGVLIIFPTIANIFPNVAFLAFLRHIEYLSLYFVAAASIRDKKQLIYIIWALIFTFIGVTLYGIGQRYLGLPAYLTMNEEFAKGIPITLSELSRVPSTFAGHYDLAAYLVLMIPILLSLAFGFKNIIIKIFLLLISLLGVLVLIMTVSRVSFAVLFVALFAVLYFQQRRLALAIIPFVLILGVIFVSTQSSLVDRFGSTIKEVDVLVDANTGTDIGHVEYVPFEFLKDKTIVIEKISGQTEVDNEILLQTQVEKGLTYEEYKSLFKKTPVSIPLINANMTSNGEILPQGTGYINLPLSRVNSRLGNFFYEQKSREGDTQKKVHIISGEFLVKRAAAYDLSFTTRFQGEWPNTIEAFKRNLMLGSGYGSVSLAVDNNYLRILGEIGLLGFAAFMTLFISFFVYVKKTLPHVESKLVKSFIYGVISGFIGLAFNAVLIDVFEASKIAFLMWILIGVVVGILTLYRVKDFEIGRELLKSVTSSYALIFYFWISAIGILLPTISNYFVGDDFTWFRWAADCKSLSSNIMSCHSVASQIVHYFTSSDGFFYRPGTKTYFLLMYNTFWLNPVVYHIVLIILHSIFVALFFILSRKILKDKFLAALSTLIFLISSGYLEIAVWVSATGHLFNAVFILLSLLLYILWDEKKESIFLVLSILSVSASLLFYELGVIAPLLMIAYKFTRDDNLSFRSFLKIFKSWQNIMIFTPIVLYGGIRIASGSHWFSGDYSYNILKLPFNFIGNFVGYINLLVFGPLSLPFYNLTRNILKSNILVLMPVILIIGGLAIYALTKYGRKIQLENKNVIIFGLLFFIIALLPFLGLGNISSRYSYLASFGIIIILVLAFKSLYEYLMFNGKNIALGGISILFLVFSLLHIIQGQQVFIDWNESGKKVERFLISLGKHYSPTWSKQEVNLYLTKVPIKNGDSWVFPVGLEDSIWFAFKNENIKITTFPDSATAYQNFSSIVPTWVLEFQGDGSLERVLKNKNGTLIYAE